MNNESIMNDISLTNRAWSKKTKSYSFCVIDAMEKRDVCLIFLGHSCRQK